MILKLQDNHDPTSPCKGSADFEPASDGIKNQKNYDRGDDEEPTERLLGCTEDLKNPPIHP